MNVFCVMLSWAATIPSLILSANYATSVADFVAMFYSFAALIFAGTCVVLALVQAVAKRLLAEG